MADMEEDKSKKQAVPLTKEQEELVVNAMPLVRQYVYRYAATKHYRPDTTEEFVAEGYLALVELAPRYDPKMGVNFWTFAEKRVLGAILDLGRQSDHLTRNSRKILKRIRKEWDFISAQPSNTTTIQDFIDSQNLDENTKVIIEEEMQRALDPSQKAHTISLSAKIHDTNLPVESVTYDPRESPEDLAIRRNESMRNRNLLNIGYHNCNPKEQLYLNHLCQVTQTGANENEKMKTGAAVAREMGVTEGYVTQLKKSSFKKVKRVLSATEKVFMAEERTNGRQK